MTENSLLRVALDRSGNGIVASDDNDPCLPTAANHGAVESTDTPALAMAFARKLTSVMSS